MCVSCTCVRQDETRANRERAGTSDVYHPALVFPAFMAPKRARTAAARASASSSSSPADAAAPKLTLHGGVPHHPSLAGLWRDERLTDRRLGSVGEHESEAQRPCLGGA